jgi:hypothetical protein
MLPHPLGVSFAPFLSLCPPATGPGQPHLAVQVDLQEQLWPYEVGAGPILVPWQGSLSRPKAGLDLRVRCLVGP